MSTETSPVVAGLSRAALATIGIAAALVHALAMIPGYNEDNDFDTAAWLTVTAISIVVALVVFLAVVPRGSSRAALILAILALLTTLVFWVMVSLPLAVAAIVIALRERRGESSGMASAALVIAVIAVLALAGIIIGDAGNSD